MSRPVTCVKQEEISFVATGVTQMLGQKTPKCIFSVDVEDWFHILDVPSTPEMSVWNSLPSRVEQDFMKLLELFGERDVHVTCFFLGWVAQRFPHLVRAAKKQGHEIASHGYGHRLVYKMAADEFFRDADLSKKILEDITGGQVLGYRSSGFSVTEQIPWFFDKLLEAGYRYDSSVFPAPRGHGGMKTENLGPHLVSRNGRNLVEFPITVRKLLGRPICFFGGGYLRLFPYPLIKEMARQVLSEGRPVVFYVHPREIDPHHPRLQMSLVRRFKSYINLDTTENKIKRLVSDFQLTTFESLIRDNPYAFGV